jgi:hypothetical protein
MNIIEATKQLEPGKIIVSESGIEYRLDDNYLLCTDEGEGQWIYKDDLLSEKWTVVDE